MTGFKYRSISDYSQKVFVITVISGKIECKVIYEIFMNQKVTYNIIIPAYVGAIISRLQGQGFQAFPVGGAIRDSITGRCITDWDITTDASPEEIKKVFHDMKSFSLKHETVTLIDSGNLSEVTTMKDLNNKPKSIEADLGFRDFTVDAMAFDTQTGLLIDPYGGADDIERKIIRGVINPSERFSEDPLRMLRAVRLSSELKFTIENVTLDAVLKMSAMLESISRERIRDELVKLLTADKPSEGLKTLVKSGLMKYVIPELLEGLRKQQNGHHKYTVFRHIAETVDLVPPDPVLRIAALLHDVAKPRVRKKIDGEFRFYDHAGESALLAEEILKKLRFSNDVIKKTVRLIDLHMVDYNESWSRGAVRRLIRRAGSENIQDLILLRKADLKAHGKGNDDVILLEKLEKRIREAEKENSVLSTENLAVDGKKIMKIPGIKRGPIVGKILSELLEIVTDTPELNNEKDLIRLASELAKDMNR